MDAEASSAQKSDERSQERRMQIFSTVCGKFTALVAVVGKHVIMPLANYTRSRRPSFRGH